MNLYLDFIGLIISMGIIWGIIPNTVSTPIKIFLTLFYILDHTGMIPTITLIFKEKNESEEENSND